MLKFGQLVDIEQLEGQGLSLRAEEIKVSNRMGPAGTRKKGAEAGTKLKV